MWLELREIDPLSIIGIKINWDVCVREHLQEIESDASGV